LPRGAHIGILGQVTTTSDRFKRLFARYPHDTDVIHPNGERTDRTIAKRTIKMVDSGVFGKHGCDLDYADLFEAYERMNADYGVMIDVLRDSAATVASARRALRAYSQRDYQFELVGVAQGNQCKDYLRCYRKLQNMGFSCIAIGGLLRKRKNTVRYTYVRSQVLMDQVLRQVRAEFDPSWLFALGVFHPKRIPLFVEHGVWGSDYKGWLFNYEKKDTVLAAIEDGSLAERTRIACDGMKAEDVKRMTEQELRFRLTRAFIQRKVLEAIGNGKGRGRDRQ